MKKYILTLVAMLVVGAAHAQSFVMQPLTTPTGGLAFQSQQDKALKPLIIDRNGFVRLSPVVSQKDDFTGRSIDANRWFVTAGTSASASLAPISNTGIVSFTTAASTTLATADVQLTGERNWRPIDGPVSFETRLMLNNSSSVVVFAGLVNSTTLVVPASVSATAGGAAGVSAATVTSGTATSLIGLVFDASTSLPVFVTTTQPRWWAVGLRDSVSMTGVSTTVGHTPGTFQTLRINLQPNGNAAFYIDGVRVANMALTSGSYPTSRTDLFTPYVGVMSRNNLSRNLQVDYIDMNQAILPARP